MENRNRGFTLVELLVSLSIVSMLIALALPGFSSLRRKAVQLQGMSNLKQIHYALGLFANDHGDMYPSSVSWVGDKPYHPRRMVSASRPSRATHRSMSGYLYEYISDMSIFTCPAAPEKLPDMQLMWDAGDEYFSRAGSLVFNGHYCFYWDYEGLLEGGTNEYRRFRGPKGPGSDKKRFSTLLVSDYFGRDNDMDVSAYKSCEWFEGASGSSSTDISAVYWLKDPPGMPVPEVRQKAVFVDGHVEIYTTADGLLKLHVYQKPDLNTLKPNVNDGYYFLPTSALH